MNSSLPSLFRRASRMSNMFVQMRLSNSEKGKYGDNVYGPAETATRIPSEATRRELQVRDAEAVRPL